MAPVPQTAYDSTNPFAIPVNAEVVCGYVDGIYVWSQVAWARFPNSLKVTIAVSAQTDADVLDVETGDASPDEAPAWAVRQRERGANPTVYCSRLATWPPTLAAFQDAGVAQPQYWIADYTDAAHLVPGSVCTQWSGTTTGPYDISITNGVWPNNPTPNPPPIPEGTPPEMITALNNSDNTTDVYYVGADARVYQLHRDTKGKWTLYQPTALSGDGTHPVAI